MADEVKLVDAELLTTNIAQIAKACAKSDKQKALVGRILFMIEHMPTIEAEPDNGWISVKDKLPAVTVDTHTSQIVMCFSRDNEYEFFFDVYNALSKKFMSEAQNGCKVTHWRPLPKKPKGE